MNHGLVFYDYHTRYDLEVIESYIEKGLVERNNHPTLPLSIYNYTRKCQFEKAWDEVTLSCRGLVLDDKGVVIAQPLKKFFNLEEMNYVPNSEFTVYEKMDGSLGICFYYGDKWHMATKGSFTSEQAIRGMEMLRSKYASTVSGIMLTNHTFFFEIIYRENRIVVDYDFEDVVLLAVIDHKGRELDVEEDTIYSKFLNVVKHYNGITDYRELKNLVKDNQEGFVVKFKDGNNTRMKIKGEEYVRLHRLLTNFSNIDIWECLKNGDDINKFLERVPDEFDEWVRKKVMEMKVGFELIEGYCWKIHDYFKYGKYYDLDTEPTRKDFALHLQANVEKKYHGVLFAMWNNNESKIRDSIWKMIRPEYQKPFWNKNTEE